MRTRFKVQAGLALVLSAFQLSASALTLLPGAPVLDTGLVTGIGFALLFPLFIATIAQGIAVTADLGAGAGQGWVQWLALRCLPRAVQACVACLFAAGIALLVIGGEGPRQSGPVRDGRYYALDTSPSHRGEVEVGRSEHEVLVRADQRFMFSITGLLAAGAGTLTLIHAVLGADGTAARSGPRRGRVA
ncbi:hypothetical protein [Streptomyces pristinaespiralis]|uniref:hypothetical protein n=1 Tax=Streptomyces pristinaespiralis TaxID=38300 RepID=UPI00383902D0